MASEGPKYPTSSGSGIGWGPGSSGTIIANDNGFYRFTFSAGGNEVSTEVEGITFGFSSDVDGTIDGIIVEVGLRASAADNCRDTFAKLEKASFTPIGTDKSSNTLLGTTEQILTYGSSSDLWGSTWTAAEIQAAGFGFNAKYTSEPGKNGYVELDYVRITVYYTPTNLRAYGRSISPQRSSAVTSVATITINDRPLSATRSSAVSREISDVFGQSSSAEVARADYESHPLAAGRSSIVEFLTAVSGPNPILVGISRIPILSRGPLTSPDILLAARELSSGHSRGASTIVVSGAIPAFGIAMPTASSSAPSTAITTAAGYFRSATVIHSHLEADRIIASVNAMDRSAAYTRTFYVIAAGDQLFGLTRQTTRSRAIVKSSAAEMGRSFANAGAAFGLKSAKPDVFGSSLTERHSQVVSGARIQARARDVSPSSDGDLTSVVIGTTGRLYDPENAAGRLGAVDAMQGREVSASLILGPSGAAVAILAMDSALSAEQALGTTLAIVSAVSLSAAETSQVTRALPGAFGSDWASTLEVAMTQANSASVSLAEVANWSTASPPSSTAGIFTSDMTVIYDRFRLVATVDLRGASFVTTVGMTLQPSLSIQGIATVKISQAATCRVSVY